MVAINKEFLQQGPINLSLVSKLIQDANNANIGAYSIFLGQVRADRIENKPIKLIEYSAYEEMLTLELEKITHSILNKYDDIRKMYMIHSIGKVRAGEISLCVFIGCGHRRQAFKSVEEVVDLIKANLPIWKKEYFEDGSYIWTQNNH